VPTVDQTRSGGDGEPRGARRWSAVIGVLTAGAIALAVLSIVWTVDVHAHDSAADRRNAVLAAATVAMNDLVNLSGPDQASAEKQLNALIAISTGSFKAQFAGDVPSEAALFVRTKAMSVGKVDAVGVNGLTRKAATTTVAAEARISNTQSPQGKTTYYKMTVALAYQQGRWLVSSVGFVP
jgi:Mce-associated membrane protein